MDTIKINKGSTKLIAHRGLSGLETENSIPAFVAAGNRSYYGVETDTHVTSDGRFVVLHDDSTGRVAWDDIPVESSRYRLVRKIRLKDLHPVTETTGCGHIHERQDMIVPSLAEYISICKKYEKTCILELKNEFNPEDIRRLVEEIKALDYLEHVTFISFALNNMRNLRELLPDQNLYYLCGEYNGDILKTLKQYRVHLDIYYKALTREIVEELHREGILVNCWTCDDREEAERLVGWGVDFITTNLLE
ncbi:MAG: hypothetical protein HFH92_10795 [Lachnospiraceae bacterium]|uniref:glycerophosphodiester phosphodiesterase n=1 Tax=uncultured Acetatifactor sp. TaxID=1671927 RepID=UPI002631C8B9|nr:glycerophosphodiester phosphodiesterase family protein [uncultured Acetatifactor sp.]MCI8789579.1 hypothetical protein [Lachnospiraceae bacterium]